jgi:predicted lysophospholipase L1 biosynthesis ABC-type transport system permease subunit
MAQAVDGPTDERALFVQMAREFPVRTVIFSFGLPIFALAQVVNGVLNSAALAVVTLFALATVAFSVQLTRYQVAVYRRRRTADRVA